jgi:hypothetical protein
MRATGGRSGFVLPLVLLLLPAFLALALAAFHLAQGQLALAGLDTRLLEEMAAAHPPATRVPAPGEVAWSLSPGGGGAGGAHAVGPIQGAFFLLRAPAGPLLGERRGHRVVWVPHPPGLASVWVQGSEGPPRFGPIPVEVLLDRISGMSGMSGERGGEEGGEGAAEGDRAGEWILPGGRHLRAPGGWLVPLGEDGILLLAPGAVHLTGSGVLPAVVLAVGEVLVLGDLELRGSVRTPSGVRLDPGAHITPDSALVHTALLHPFLARPHLLPGGERLGRF